MKRQPSNMLEYQAIDSSSEADSLPTTLTESQAAGELGGRLAGKSLAMQVFSLSLWPFLEHLLNSLVGFTDVALAGRLSVAATEALAATGYITWLIGMLQMAVGVGAMALIARAIGGRHKRLANAALGQSIALALTWGIGLAVMIYLSAGPIARFFQLKSEAITLCVLYIQIIAFAVPLSSVLFVGAACQRGAGDTKTPFIAMTMVNIINVAASIALVFGPEPLGGHGVVGIAWGTFIGWCIGAFIILGNLIKPGGVLRLHLHRLKPHGHTLWRIIRVGAPSLLESAGLWIGNAIVARIVGGLATQGALGAHIIAIRIEAFSFLSAFAVGTAAATLTGQYLGLGRPDQARQAVKLCWILGAGIMTITGLLFMIIPQTLTRLLAPNEPQLYELAATVLRIAGPAQLFFGTYLVLSQALRGAGDTTVAMIITYVSTYLVRLPLAYVLAVTLDLGLKGLWLGLCAELAVRGCLYIWRFMQGGWQKVHI